MDFVSWDVLTFPKIIWKVRKFHGSSHHQPEICELVLHLYSCCQTKTSQPNSIPKSPPAEAPNKYKSNRMSNVAQMLKIATEPLLKKNVDHCGPTHSNVVPVLERQTWCQKHRNTQ